MKNITISDQVVIGATADTKGEFSDLVRYCSIEKLKNDEHEKEYIMKMFKNKDLSYDLCDKVIMALLLPKELIERPVEEEGKFALEADLVISLIDQVTKIVQEQPMLLKVEAPIKVFGDIHGQYQDLMRFFDLYSAPIQGPRR